MSVNRLYTKAPIHSPQNHGRTTRSGRVTCL